MKMEDPQESVHSLHYKQLVLKCLEFQVKHRFPMYNLKNVEVGFFETLTTEALLAFKFKIYAHDEFLKEEHITVPRNWWEAFKEEYFPEWWLKRHPIKTTTHRLIVNLQPVFPELETKFENYNVAVMEKNRQLFVEHK